MSKYLRSAGLAALTAAAACAVSTIASAQEYDRLVVIGDSLSDSGNLARETGGIQPPAPFYPSGRFSNGPVFTELLGFNANGFMGLATDVSGDVNLAFGGAVTGRRGGLDEPLGLTDQLDIYLALGGDFGDGDLVSVLGGANNLFDAVDVILAGGAPSPQSFVQGVALSAAADMTGLVGRIADAGAGTILVTNLPTLSTTPAFRETPLAALMDFGASTFNSGLLTGMRGVAAANPGSNVIVVDLFKASVVLAQSPDAFGITNATAPCFNQTALTICSNPDDFFYYDSVHPTAAGHRLLAALANDYLYYADIGSASALQGETAYRHREDSLDLATGNLSGSEPWAAGTTLSVGGSIDRSETDARGRIGKAESEGYGLNIALESGPSESLRFGMVGSARFADVDAGPLQFEVETLGIDVYGGWRSGGLFVVGAAGIANDNIDDIERLTSLAPIVHTSETEGTSRGARLQAGYWFDMGGIAISPRAAVTYASSDLNAYFEQGAAATYSYGDRVVEGVTGEVGLRAEADLGGFGVFAEGGYRDTIDDSSEAVQVGIAGNTARVLSRDVDEPFGGQFLASLGVDGDLGPVKVSVGYRGRFGDKADSHMGAIRFSLPL